MDYSIVKCKFTFKFSIAFLLLFSSLVFVSPAHATAREVDTSYTPPSIQLAYYGYHHHHHHWRHHHWCRHHWCYHRHHRHHYY